MHSLKFKGGMFISPQNSIRSGWKEAIELSLSENEAEPLDHEWLDLPLDSDDDLESNFSKNDKLS